MVTPFHIISQFIHQHQVAVLLATEAMFVLTAIGWMVISSFQNLLHHIWSELCSIRAHLDNHAAVQKKQEDASNG